MKEINIYNRSNKPILLKQGKCYEFDTEKDLQEYLAQFETSAIWDKQEYVKKVTQTVDNFILEYITPFPMWFGSIEEVLARASDKDDPFYIKAKPVKTFLDSIYLHLENYFLNVTEDTIVPLEELLGHYRQIGEQISEELNQN